MNNTYRKNVGIVLFNSQGKVLLCERNDQQANRWQFPQGGVEKDEGYLGAALRELYEETGIKSVKLIAQTPQALRYDFPSTFKLPFKGQEQHWFLFYFTGQDAEINFTTNPQEIEFKSYQWADIDIAPKIIVKFKKKVYNNIVKFFKPLIREYLQGKKL